MKTPPSWQLKTARLFLDPVKVSDAQDFYPHFSNPEICRDMAWSAHTSIAESESFLQQAELAFRSKRAVHWAVRNDGETIGLFSLIDIRGTHRSIEYNRAELAYWLAPNYQRQGFMTEAGLAVIAFAFDKMELRKLLVSHHAANEASRKLICKMGFELLYKETESFLKNNQVIDVWHYSLSREQWTAANQNAL